MEEKQETETKEVLNPWIVRFENSEQVEKICRLINHSLKDNIIPKDYKTAYNELLEILRNKKQENPEELNRMEKLISNLEDKEKTLGITIEKAIELKKELEKKWDNEIQVKIDKPWNDIISDLLNMMGILKEGQDALAKQYDFILERLGDIENKVVEDKSEEKNEPEVQKGQIETSEKKDEEKVKEKISEESEVKEAGPEEVEEPETKPQEIPKEEPVIEERDEKEDLIL